MRRHLISAVVTAALAMTAVNAAPPEGKGGGKGGGGDGGGDDPSAEPFVPAIAYFEETQTGKELRLANRAGDQACLIVQTQGGSPKLRGFAYDAANQRVAYSIGETGVYLTSWSDDPCVVSPPTEVRKLSVGDYLEYIDFSPDGRLLVWTESDPDNYNSNTIVMHEIGGGTSELALEGWLAGGIRFSPDFESSKELIFRGGANDLSLGWGADFSIFAYNVETEAVRKVFDGGGRYLDSEISVTNSSSGEAKVALTDLDSGNLLQVSVTSSEIIESFAGYEPAYSCDNSELIHSTGLKGNKYSIYITSADGSSSELWTRGNLRWFDWFCP